MLSGMGTALTWTAAKASVQRASTRWSSSTSFWAGGSFRLLAELRGARTASTSLDSCHACPLPIPTSTRIPCSASAAARGDEEEPPHASMRHAGKALRRREARTRGICVSACGTPAAIRIALQASSTAAGGLSLRPCLPFSSSKDARSGAVFADVASRSDGEVAPEDWAADEGATVAALDPGGDHGLGEVAPLRPDLARTSCSHCRSARVAAPTVKATTLVSHWPCGIILPWQNGRRQHLRSDGWADAA